MIQRNNESIDKNHRYSKCFIENVILKCGSLSNKNSNERIAKELKEIYQKNWEKLSTRKIYWVLLIAQIEAFSTLRILFWKKKLLHLGKHKFFSLNNMCKCRRHLFRSHASCVPCSIHISCVESKNSTSCWEQKCMFA